MLQNLTKGKMVEWVVLLVALVALGLSIAAIAKPCKDTFASALNNCTTGWQQLNGPGPNCCDLKDPQGTCNSGYYCSQSEICPSGQCVPGTHCAKSGNSCEHAPCCEGLKCLGGQCVGSTPPSSCDPNKCRSLNCTNNPRICDQCGGMCEDGGRDGWVCKC